MVHTVEQIDRRESEENVRILYPVQNKSKKEYKKKGETNHDEFVLHHQLLFILYMLYT